MEAKAGREGSRVERSKGLKESAGLGCELEVTGAMEVTPTVGGADTPTDEGPGPAQGLKEEKKETLLTTR